MPKQMNYTHPATGKVYSESYWRIAQLNLNKDGASGYAVFHGFADKADSDRAKIMPGAAASLIIGVKEYVIGPDDFADFFAPAVVNPQDLNHWKQAYLFATAKQDILLPGDDPENPQYESFFATAQDVDVQD